MARVKALALLLLLTASSVPARAMETWVEASPDYGKPFRSKGFSGSLSDGMGAILSLEAVSSPYWTLGVDYEQMKIDEHATTDELGVAALSARFMRWNWGGARPYAQLHVGALTGVTSNDPLQTRSLGLDAQIGFGFLLCPPDQPWGVDAGVDFLTNGGGAGLNLGQAHAGIFVRMGSAPSGNTAP